LPRTTRLRTLSLALLAGVLFLAAACGSSSGGSSKSATTAAGGGTHAPVTVRLGYFPNLTHATAIVGVEKGIFAKDLGTDKLSTKTFADGTAASEAINAGAIDATYIGSGPAINLFQKSGGKAIKIISGATSGGAELVVSKDITSAADLKGKTISDPKLGNTQDVSLRAWLKKQGYTTDTTGGGDVKIAPQENSQTLDAFKAGTIDGAWVPEPWASRLVVEGGGHVLVDERDLFPKGDFPTTVLVVTQKFLAANPAVVKELLQGQIDANDYVNANSADSQTTVNTALKALTGKDLKPAVITAAWKYLKFTNDPIASALQTAADNAKDVTLLDSNDIKGITDLDPLNALLKAKGQPELTGL